MSTMKIWGIDAYGNKTTEEIEYSDTVGNWLLAPLDLDKTEPLTVSSFANALGLLYDLSAPYKADERPEFGVTYDDDYDDLPDWLKDALCSLESDNVVPEWERVYLTQAKFVQIPQLNNRGGQYYKTVSTDEYEFDTFGCGYYEPKKALYVRVYADSFQLQPTSDNDKPPIVVCATCDCGISTYGLIGDVATCEHCGTLNSAYPKVDGQDDKPTPGTLTTNQLKQVNGRYGLWQHTLP
jgi:hypothetical protein